MRLHRPAGIVARQEHPTGVDTQSAPIRRERAALPSGGGERGPREPEQPTADARLVAVDIEGGGPETTGLERIGQGVLVDEGPPGDIDKTGPRFERREARLGDEGFPVRAGGRTEDDAVARGQEAGQGRVEGGAAQLGLELGGLADDVVVVDLHAEGRVAQLGGDQLADLAQADEAQDVAAWVVRVGRRVVVGEAEGGFGGFLVEGGAIITATTCIFW